ncbi:nucleotide exchange factor GrpE [Planktothrix sp. FACHB-1365]|uniref:nucleotide exchange factor GrpE n=1 Tax=Planktothrix sp. FACHB-1365 TaxID=2692855 RepID=UPI00168448FB|nr:nucleotide exchange factor GrpE [Planktothrix sp. FACHB-1365]MBD2480742.1 nucleotide exchange factor GrpE [Planktothrix sp. FACHB-1365]
MMPNSTANTPDELTGQSYSTSESDALNSDNLETQATTATESSSYPEVPTDESVTEDSSEKTFGQEIESTGEGLHAEVIALAEANAALKAQLEDVSGQYRRLAADFENFRKRTQKEKEELEITIKGSTLKPLLPVVDNFDRARSQIKPQTDSEMNIHKSYQGVYKLMVDCLKQLGVSVMRPEGQPFDPNLHEAVMREATDAYPEGTVIEDLMHGYQLGEKVLRHAMVKVATAPEPDSTESTAEETPSEA